MVALKPLRLIEGQAEEILAPVVEQIHSDPALKYLRRASGQDLREWGSRILDDLSGWLVDRNNKSLAWRYNDPGRCRPARSAPLHEAPLHEIMRALHILKKNIVAFLRDQEGNPPAAEMCAEEELGEFFDWLEEQLARAYEQSRIPQGLQGLPLGNNRSRDYIPSR